jgi:hypothetical protein
MKGLFVLLQPGAVATQDALQSLEQVWAKSDPWLKDWVLALAACFVIGVIYALIAHFRLGKAVEAIRETLAGLGPLDDEVRLKGRDQRAIDAWRNRCKSLESIQKTLSQAIESELVLLRDENHESRYMRRDGEMHRLGDAAIVERFVNTRFMDALPGLLTAAGLVGTFAAIAVGLGELNPQKNGVILGVDGLLSKIGGKFVTSIVALGLALLFQVLDSLVFANWQATVVRKLQESLAEAFPLIGPQQQLATLVEIARRQDNALSNISSDVVGRFEDVFSNNLLPNLADLLTRQMSSGMVPVLEQVASSITSLEVAVARLESGKTDSITDEVRRLTSAIDVSMRSALEDIARQFGSALSGTADGEFKNATAALGESASVLRGMNDAFGGMQDTLQRLLQDAENRASRAFEEGEGRTKALNALVEQLLDQLNQKATSSADEVQRLMVSAVSAMSERFTALAKEMEDKARESTAKSLQVNEEVVALTTAAAGRTSEEVERLLARLGERADDFVQAADQLKELRIGVESVIASTGERIRELNEAASAFRLVATEASSLTGALRDTHERQRKAAEGTTAIVDQVANLNREQQQALVRTQETFRQAEQVLGTLDVRLASAMREIMSRMQDYNTVVEKNFANIMGSVNQRMPALFERLEGSLQQVGEVVEELAETMGNARRGGS